MKILVTGGAGFIGANFIRRLLQKHPEYKVICLDSLTYAGNIDSLLEPFENPRFRFYYGDIADRTLVFNLVRRESPDILVNFAAETHVDRSIEDPEVFLKTNVLGTFVLLEAAKKFRIGRYHQISTDEVYGDLPLEKKEVLFTEDSPLRASSPYSASKASADLLALAYFRTYRMPVTVSRCSNNYGPFQFPEKLIPLMISRAYRNQPLPVYGKGENIRDWIHVQDHCEAVDRIIHGGKPGEVYNIGGRQEMTNLDVVKTILRVMNKPESLIEFVKDRPGHDLRYAVDPGKMERELGWKPEIRFDDGIRNTVEWYLSNRKWWERILSGEYHKAKSSFVPSDDATDYVNQAVCVPPSLR